MTPSDEWLRFERGSDADLAVFLTGASSNHPIRVILTGDHWGPEACRIIASSRQELDLRVVFLRGAHIGDAGIEILANSTALASVRSLGVECCGLTDLGVKALARSPNVRGLRELYLCNRNGIETGTPNEIGDAGAAALAASSNLSRLEVLDLWNTHVGDHGLEAIVASSFLALLSNVNAWGTRLTREGASRVKAMASERWKRRTENVAGAAFCTVYTDYDERTILY